MLKRGKTRRRSEGGIVLLIAIFVLMLISVVAIALLVSSGTETALGANYRSSSTVYYAAVAGLEEARGRLLPKNPNYFGASIPSPFPLGETVYMLNRLTGETVAPWDSSNPYYDKEYQAEFGVQASSATWHSVSSIWDNNARGIPGPVYKWVRINAATEQSLFMDVDQDGTIDAVPALYYDPAHVDSHGNPTPSLIVPAGSPPSTAGQALEITALAALPDGSQKYLQYLVWPSTVTLPPFPAAITLVGNNVDYTGPSSASAWYGSGNDTISLGSCAPGPPVYAVGYSNNSFGDPSRGNINTGSFTGQPLNYPGVGGTSSVPSLGFIGSAIPTNFQTETGLNSMVQNIIQDRLYDVLINGNATGANLPSGMSPSNPMTVVINGNLDLANSFHSQGYGLLIVTGNFNYDPDSSWYGIVLVIGQGTVSAIPGRAGDSGQIVGALFVAKTVGAPLTGGSAMPGTSLPDSGDNNAEFPDTTGSFMNGRGIYYSSCWIKAAAPTGSFRVIAFHEIPQ